MKKYILITLGVMLSGCILLGQASGGLSVGPERLYSLTFSEKTLDIQVESYGCTKANDFVIQVMNKNELLVLRNKADNCRAMPRVIDVQIPLPELAEGDYYIKNAYVYKR